MLLPQSSAFVSLRNRLSAVNSAGFLHIAPKSYATISSGACKYLMRSSGSVSNVSSTRSKLGREEIKWNELLSHFRAVQNKHEKARRQVLGTTSMDEFVPLGTPSPNPPPVAAPPPTTNGTGARPPARRRVTGTTVPELPSQPARPPSRALSPLNPRARGSTTLGMITPVPPSPTFASGTGRGTAQPKRTLSLNRKS